MASLCRAIERLPCCVSLGVVVESAAFCPEPRDSTITACWSRHDANYEGGVTVCGESVACEPYRPERFDRKIQKRITAESRLAQRAPLSCKLRVVAGLLMLQDLKGSSA